MDQSGAYQGYQGDGWVGGREAEEQDEPKRGVTHGMRPCGPPSRLPFSTPHFLRSPHFFRGLQEDDLLRRLVDEIGPRRWTDIAARLGGRVAKQCRERCV